MQSTYPGQKPRGPAVGPGVDLTGLCGSDPWFEPYAFIDYAMAVFVGVHQAVQPNAVPGPARAMVSEDLWGQLHIGYLRGQESLLPVAQYGDVEALIDSVTCDGVWDTIVVKFETYAKSWLRIFDPHEFWTFRRPTGAAAAGRDVAVTTCPTCGAPLYLTPDGRCHYCAVPLAGNRFGWKGVGMVVGSGGMGVGHPLDEERRGAFLAQLQPITDSDPGFDVIDFLAFAQSAFTRVRGVLASTIDPTSIRALVGDEVWQQITSRTKPERKAVGSILSLDIPFAEHTTDQIGERDTVEVYFTAMTPPQSAFKVSTQFQQSATFQRVGSGVPLLPIVVRPLDCPICGAPLDLKDDDTCRHCTARLGGSRSGWAIIALAKLANHERMSKEEWKRRHRLGL